MGREGEGSDGGTRGMTRVIEVLGRCVVGLAVVVVVMAARFGGSVVFAPYPVEYREPGVVLTSRLLLAGRNPYGWGEQPGFTNLYGILYGLVVYPLARVFGWSYPLHRIVAAACAVGVCGVVAWVVRRGGGRWWLSAAGAVLVYVDLGARFVPETMLLPLSIMARPDSLGMLLFVAAVVVAWWRKYSWGSLWACVALSGLGWMAKPYFLLGFPIVVLYVALFEDLWKAAVVGFMGGAALFGLALVAGAVWPAYLNDTFYAPLAATGGPYRHMWRQAGAYVTGVPGVVAVVIVGFGARVIARVRGAGNRQAVAGPRQVWWRRGVVPGAAGRVGVFEVALLVGALVFGVKMGRHVGNWMLYAYQLVGVWVVVVGMGYVERAVRRGGWVGVLAVLAVGVDLGIAAWGMPRPLEDRRGEWAEWGRVIAGVDGEVYAPPPLAGAVFDAGKRVWDDGYSEYFGAGIALEPVGMRAKAEARWAEQREAVRAGLREGRFGMVVLPVLWGEHWPAFVWPEMLEGAGYVRAGEVGLGLPQFPWAGEVWVRRGRVPEARMTKPE